MSETSEKKPLLARAKGADLHRMRQWAKDLLLFRILPSEYRRGAEQPFSRERSSFWKTRNRPFLKASRFSTSA